MPEEGSTRARYMYEVKLGLLRQLYVTNILILVSKSRVTLIIVNSSSIGAGVLEQGVDLVDHTTEFHLQEAITVMRTRIKMAMA
jgi:hypothetical protein